jgi:2,3-diaminopropionate biosynthesis protein SbnA
LSLDPDGSPVSMLFDLTPGETRRPRAPLDGILAAIGDTPLVALRRFLGRPDVAVWAKLEAVNPGGSAKDRPAAGMLLDALRAGVVGPGTTVIESSSGNMGVGLAQACRYHGMHLICVVDARAHDTNIRTMRALGADVRVVTRPDPETGDLLVARLKLVADLLARTPGSFWPNQYANVSNPAAHAAGTMREIDEALDGEVDFVFVATSTTGTLRGCVDYLRERERTTQVVAVDAAGSALFGGRHGRRLLPGFGAGVESTLSLGAEFDGLVRVSDLDCVVGCRRLVEREAILAGASAGGVVYALESLAASMPEGSRCAAILHDGGSGYLGTVYDDGWVERELGCDAARLRALVGDGAAKPPAATR